MTFIDYFLGQPTQYDNNNQVVKRDFGIMNLLLIVFTGYILYSLFGTKNKNQRGGGLDPREWNARDAGMAFFWSAMAVGMTGIIWFFFIHIPSQAQAERGGRRPK